MVEARIYGRSDDLIEIEGDITQEIMAKYGEPTRFSLLGYIIEATYNKQGEWVFEVIEEPECAVYDHYNVGADGLNTDYSEVLVIQHPPTLEVTVL